MRFGVCAEISIAKIAPRMSSDSISDADTPRNPRVVIAGGGAAGFFAAITCAEANPQAGIHIFEKSSQVLTKVAHSGGGRCNVTHACFEPRDFATRFPRGERPLIRPLHRFSASETVEWFAARGVRLKTEADGRMFPVTNSSETIVRCLEDSALQAGVQVHLRDGVESASRGSDEFVVETTGSGSVACDRLILATGGSRVPDGARIAAAFGHPILPPVPSLFAFDTTLPWVRGLAGVSVNPVEVSVPGTSLRQTGPLLFTHRGLSGPAILRLSAWGARELEARGYQFTLKACWLPGTTEPAAEEFLRSLAAANPSRMVKNFHPGEVPSGQSVGLPSRLWEQLCGLAGVAAETRWSQLAREPRRTLARLLVRTEIPVSGKSLNKEEFVTCGGVDCEEIDFLTMESRLCPGLHFAGELLDIDGITGGFNFQAAWTTGFLAGNACAK